jgi:hypothetical protein
MTQPSMRLFFVGVLTFRAIELGASWAKAHARLAEVYVAQDRLELAMQAYTKAISLCSDNKKKMYRTLHDNIKKRHDDPTYGKRNVYNPTRGDSKPLLERLKAAVPDPLTYGHAVPGPMGYLTAMDKVCLAFVTDV